MRMLLLVCLSLLAYSGAAFRSVQCRTVLSSRPALRSSRKNPIPLKPLCTRGLQRGSATLIGLLIATKRAFAVSQPLTWHNGVSAASLVLISTSGLLFSYRNMWRGILQACLRSILQLYIIGGFVLTRFFRYERPWMVLLWIFTIGILAGQEASHRMQYTYKRMQVHLVVSVLTGGISVLTFSQFLGLLGKFDPWFSPRVWIPTAGMVFGNSLTGISLAMGSVTQQLAVDKSKVELYLCHGATIREAMRFVRRNVYSVAFNPVINFLSAAGIVHIPGMMTGQLLAGQAPFQAALYQLVIFSMIASTVLISVQMLVHLAETSLTDRNSDRLNTEQLQKRQKNAQSVSASIRWLWGFLQRFHKRGSSVVNAKETPTERPAARVVSNLPHGTFDVDTDFAFSVRNVYSSPANILLSVLLKKGDRLAIVGPSGIGKSQLLRTLAGLETVDRSTMRLSNASPMSMAEWRRRVMLISQEDVSSLEGTPNEFYREVLSFESHTGHDLPIAYGREWGLAKEQFDQPWSTLSGGEAQRIRLAIALSLQPDVLLLDESTSALDESTSLLVEKTLQSTEIPVIMVSHSQQQVERFCNYRIDLGV